MKIVASQRTHQYSFYISLYQRFFPEKSKWFWWNLKVHFLIKNNSTLNKVAFAVIYIPVIRAEKTLEIGFPWDQWSLSFNKAWENILKSFQWLQMPKLICIPPLNVIFVSYSLINFKFTESCKNSTKNMWTFYLQTFICAYTQLSFFRTVGQ
jgi:hypothetical protein